LEFVENELNKRTELNQLARNDNNYFLWTDKQAVVVCLCLPLPLVLSFHLHRAVIADGVMLLYLVRSLRTPLEFGRSSEFVEMAGLRPP
jgi:hypothetical protein